MASIVEYSELFTRNCNEYILQDSFCTILCGDLNKVRFTLHSVRKAFATIDRKDTRMVPNPIVYFPIIYNEEITKDEIKFFVDYMTANTEAFLAFFFMDGKMRFNRDIEMVQIMSTATPIGDKFVKLLYFFIFTNTISFKSINIQSLSGKGFLFTVSHDEETERNFYNLEEGEGRILFHGSPIENVYSIMRNGIKSMSKDSIFKTNGNAHGDGVYLTENILTASGYGTEGGFSRFRSYKNDEDDDISTCILIFNCKKLNHDSYVKSKGFCYVQNEKDIILRGIYWVNKGYLSDTSLSDALITYGKSIRYVPPKIYESIKAEDDVSKEVDELSSTLNGKLSISSNFDSLDNSSSPHGPEFNIIKININPVGEPSNSIKVIESSRFIKEIQRLKDGVKNGHDTIMGVSFMNPNDWRSPLIMLLKPSSGTELEKDLIKYNIPCILVAFYFTDGASVYPFAPPKIRVISPIFERQTGRVTEGGSICMDILYGDSWSASSTIASIAISASDLMSNDGIKSQKIEIEGKMKELRGGRVDPNKLGSVYTYRDYERSYNQVAGFHGFQAIN
uniref:UBC core domain-containing protein n=1 Tax=viral metagenome TaxID=1070528 RepID=A0A6C0BF71_9ZZZZ